jgi:hypothetical protein
MLRRFHFGIQRAKLWDRACLAAPDGRGRPDRACLAAPRRTGRPRSQELVEFFILRGY